MATPVDMISLWLLQLVTTSTIKPITLYNTSTPKYRQHLIVQILTPQVTNYTHVVWENFTVGIIHVRLLYDKSGLLAQLVEHMWC